MKNFNYHVFMKRLFFIFFALVLMNLAYADTSFAANSNGTNTTNITDTDQYTGLTQNETDLNQTPPNSTQPSNQTKESTNTSQNSNGTVKNLNIVKAQSVVTVPNIQGYFVNPTDTPVTSLNPTTLKADGITELFVYTVRASPQTLQPFITKFAGTGINVYAWVEAFKDFNGKWFDPVIGSTLEKQVIKDITFITTNYNINGVMLDYLRYPGTNTTAAYKHPNATANVDYFAASIKNNINTINSENIAGKHKILLSSTLMPEGPTNAYYYGQNYTQLSQYLDFLSPMIYVGNYNKNASWIASTIKYIESQANGKPVVAILQSYVSDSNPTPMSTSQLDLNIKTAVDNGSHGYELFRYGLINTGFKGYMTVPTIVTSNPANNAINVKTNQVITVTFTKNIVAGNLLIDLKNSSGKLIPLTFSINGNVLTINHPALSYGKYSLSLHTGSIADLNGNKIALSGFSFTVNKIVPKVTSTSPANNAQSVSLTSPITIKFCENVLAGVNYSKIYVKNMNTGKVVAITKKISGNTLTIKQSLLRLAHDTYEVVIPSGAVKDINGNILPSNYVFKFKAV
jgi:methionine-rich copper-binding protein CopC